MTHISTVSAINRVKRQEGLILEAEKMKQLLRSCELELREIDQIIAYRNYIYSELDSSVLPERNEPDYT